MNLEPTLENELLHLAAQAENYKRTKEESVEIFFDRIISQSNLRSTFVNIEVYIRIICS